MKKLLALLLVVMLLPTAQAHLADGEDVQVDGYLIDFGYDPAAPDDTRTTTLAFSLLSLATEEPPAFDAAWVRIAGEGVTFAGTFHPENDNIAFTYQFPDPGEYTIRVRFLNQDTIVTEYDFPITVGGVTASSGLDMMFLGIYAFGILVIIILVVFTFKPKRKSR